jgi:hypothetical protein
MPQPKRVDCLCRCRPASRGPTGLIEAGEQVLVETLLAQPAVEAFDKPILHRLAGRDVAM